MTRIRIPRPNKGGSNVFANTASLSKAVAGEPSERIGYRNPPRAHRWPPGESGNPKGRPRRGNFWADLFRGLDRPVTVTKGGKKKRMTAQQVVIDRLLAEVLRGDMKALAMLLKVMGHIEQPRQPELEQGKFRTYLQDKLSDLLHQQRIAGYNDRVAEERNPRNPEDFWKSDSSNGQEE